MLLPGYILHLAGELVSKWPQTYHKMTKGLRISMHFGVPKVRHSVSSMPLPICPMHSLIGALGIAANCLAFSCIIEWTAIARRKAFVLAWQECSFFWR